MSNKFCPSSLDLLDLIHFSTPLRLLLLFLLNHPKLTFLSFFSSNPLSLFPFAWRMFTYVYLFVCCRWCTTQLHICKSFSLFNPLLLFHLHLSNFLSFWTKDRLLLIVIQGVFRGRNTIAKERRGHFFRIIANLPLSLISTLSYASIPKIRWKRKWEGMRE